MANYTTNYNLKKPLGSENYNVADQNGNMDLIDAAMKANADAIAKDEEGIAYRLGNTNTTGATLAVGTYVYVTGNTNGVSNGMYKVTKAIAANGSLTTSKLGSVPGGVANSLNGNMKPKNDFAIVEGYVQAGGGNTIVPYPTGYGQYTCCVIATYSDLFGTRYNNESTCYSTLESNGVNLHLPGGGSGTALVRAALMKTGI